MVSVASRERKSSDDGLIFLLAVHILVMCASLALVARRFHYFHIEYDPTKISDALISIILVGLIAPIFVIARFSFGYIAGFFLFTTILNYVWISHFTPLVYRHHDVRLSMALSLLAFLIPATFVTAPFRSSFLISLKTLDRLVLCILALTVVTLAACASYGFVFVGLDRMYFMRKNLYLPASLNYAVGILTTALLPYAAAATILRRHWWQAGAALSLSMSFYPVVFTKMALLSPFWLIFLALLSGVLRARTVAIVCLFLPALVGIALYGVPWSVATLFFDTVNFRFLAIPASGIDHYAEFFSNREHTWFCHVSFLQMLMDCPYGVQLGVVMQREYGLGNFNASLFATEGIAAVGLVWAPLSAFVCGVVIALGNKASSGLSPRFVSISSAMVVVALLDVPLTTILLTHGAALLFLLWLITPRSAFTDRSA